MARRQVTQSGLARDIGVDRSTISQLLNGDGARLPNAHVVGECAAALNVSADWLLSLSDRPENTADLLASSIALTPATVPKMPSSHPLMTCPAPTLNCRGEPLEYELSNTRPSVRRPV